MAQQYSLAHLTVLGCAPPEMTYIAARAGYDYVSLRPIFMGLPGEGWHLEFTVSNKPPEHKPDNDDLLVFYASSLTEFADIKKRFVINKVKHVKPANPYWEKNGITFEDPDGFRIVISIVRIL